MNRIKTRKNITIKIKVRNELLFKYTGADQIGMNVLFKTINGIQLGHIIGIENGLPKCIYFYKWEPETPIYFIVEKKNILGVTFVPVLGGLFGVD